MKRTPEEININNYNPEWLKAWDGNMDLSICLDFFAIVTYITDYYTKTEPKMTKALQAAAKACQGKEWKDQVKTLAQTFLTYREASESEIIYRVMPHLHLSESNAQKKRATFPNQANEEGNGRLDL